MKFYHLNGQMPGEIGTFDDHKSVDAFVIAPGPVRKKVKTERGRIRIHLDPSDIENRPAVVAMPDHLGAFARFPFGKKQFRRGKRLESPSGNRAIQRRIAADLIVSSGRNGIHDRLHLFCIESLIERFEFIQSAVQESF